MRMNCAPTVSSCHYEEQVSSCHYEEQSDEVIPWKKEIATATALPRNDGRMGDGCLQFMKILNFQFIF